MKKVLSVFLVVAILTLCMPVNVNAETVIKGENGDIVYFDNSVTNYSEVYIYLWNQGGEMAWPGEKMTHLGNNIWAYTLTDNYDNLIFSQGNSDRQSADLIFSGNTKQIAEMIQEATSADLARVCLRELIL